MTAAVLVPIKGFTAAKARLNGALDPAARADLAREMAATVLAAAAPLPVLVVTDDDEVASFAVAHGADVLHQQTSGLNAAVTEGVAHLAASGVDRVVVAHADIPRAAKLADLAAATDDAGDVVLVPDRHEDGTNVLVVPATAGFVFAYGRGSFTAHQAEAARLHLRVRVVHDDDLAWDVDTADDLSGATPPTMDARRPPAR
jgi:2-phospho-L-lactate guanylyltransferase